MPTARQIEIFLAAVDAGSFRQTAERLGISQASVSKQIDALERAVGGAVFLRRRGARAELSRIGIALQRDAQRLLQLHRAVAGRNARTGRDDEDLVIYVRHFLLESAIKPRLEDLHDRGLPHGAQFVIVDDADELVWRVSRTRHAIGLLRTLALSTGAHLRVAMLSHQDCSLYAAPALAQRLSAGSLERTGLPLLLPRRGLSITESLSLRLLEAGFSERQFRHGAQFYDLLIKDAQAGLGAIVLMDSHARNLVPTGTLVRLEGVDMRLRLYAIGNADGSGERFGRLVEAFRTIN